MGFFKYIKKSFEEEYDLDNLGEYADHDDKLLDDGSFYGENKLEKHHLEKMLSGESLDEVSQNEAGNNKRKSKGHKNKESKSKNQKSKEEKSSKEEKNKVVIEAKQRLQKEEEKYDHLLNSVQAKNLIEEVNKTNKANYESEKSKQTQDIADEQELVKLRKMTTKSEPDEEDNIKIEPKQLDEVDTQLYNAEEIKSFIHGQCEVMEEASSHVEMAMEEYENVTQHFSDIQVIEELPPEIHSRIVNCAERVDNITVDRKVFRNQDSRLSKRTYKRLEQFEDELPQKLNDIQSQETYYEAVKQDMRMLEGERMGLRLEAKALTRRQGKLKNFALISAAALIVFFIVCIAVLSVSKDKSNITIFVIVAALGAFLALGLFYIMKATQREVLLTQIKLNKATTLLNKTKIKYVNAANTLDYEYEKFDVKSSYELSQKYSAYIDMKDEQKRITQMTTMLNEAEIELERELRKVGLYDVHIWLSQVKALFDKNEMVEVRHALLERRQKLREQIEYNQNRIEEAKANITKATKKYPAITEDALKIIDRFEKKNRK